MNRSSFLKMLGCSVASMSISDVRGNSPVWIISPIHIKLSCNFYSFNEELKNGEMGITEAIDFCSELGFDAVDITGYYFSNYPEVPSDVEIYDIKKYAFRKGLDISGTGVRNNFTLADKDALNKEIQHVKDWISVSAKLDAPVLRIFTGRPKEEEYIDHAKERVVQSIKECVDEGKKQGVIIVLQNHDELLKTADEVLEVYHTVNSDWFGINLDIGSLRMKKDPYEEIKKLAPFADTWQIKGQVYRNRVKEEVDISKIIAIVKESDYKGYLPLEVLGEGDHKEKLRNFISRVRKVLS